MGDGIINAVLVVGKFNSWLRYFRDRNRYTPKPANCFSPNSKQELLLNLDTELFTLAIVLTGLCVLLAIVWWVLRAGY